MALAFVQSTAKATTNSTSGSITTDAISTTTGNLILIAAFASASAAITISDSQVNGWTEAVSGAAPVRIFYGYSINGNAAHTFTASASGSHALSIVAQEFSGFGAGDPLDKTASATAQVSSPVSSGSTASTTDANEVIFGVAYNQSGQPTLGAGFSNLGTAHADASGGDYWISAESKIVAATSTYDAQFAIAFFVNANVAVATFKSVANAAISVSNSITVSESVSLQPLTSVSSSESIAVSDTVTVAPPYVSIPVNTSDSITVSESSNAAVALTINVSDTATITESIGKLVTTGFIPDNYKNFAFSTIATAPNNNSDTTLYVQTGDGAKFPTPRFNAVIWPVGSYYGPEAQALTTNAEIVRVVAITGDRFVVQRTQEGTTVRTIQAGDGIKATITAKTISDIWTALGY